MRRLDRNTPESRSITRAYTEALVIANGDIPKAAAVAGRHPDTLREWARVNSINISLILKDKARESFRAEVALERAIESLPRKHSDPQGFYRLVFEAGVAFALRK